MKKIFLFILLLTLASQAQIINSVGTYTKTYQISKDTTGFPGLFIGAPRDLSHYAIQTYNGGQLGSKTYLDGWQSGEGWKLAYDDTTHEYNLTVDNMTVRGTMQVYEFLINQIRATNGNLLVTASAKVDSTPAYTTPIWFITDSASTNGLSPFQAGDVIMSQRVDLSGATYDANGDVVVNNFLIKRLIYKVDSVSVLNPLKVYPSLLADAPANKSFIKKGDVFVRFGSLTNAARQGMVGIYSDEKNSPYIRITDNVNSWAAWKSASNMVTQVGNLNELQKPDGSTMSGYGIYAKRFYFYANDSNYISFDGTSFNSVINGNSVGTSIEQNDSLIALKANQTYVDTIKNQVTSDSSQISIHSDSLYLFSQRTIRDSIALRDSAIAFINLKPDSIKIAARHIEIDGATIFRTLNGTGDSTTINGGKLTTGTVRADSVASTWVYAGTLTAGQVNAVNVIADSVTANRWLVSPSITGGDIFVDTSVTIAKTLRVQPQGGGTIGYENILNTSGIKIARGWVTADPTTDHYAGVWRYNTATNKMEFSSSTDETNSFDVNLYRSAANVLKTDDAFEAASLTLNGALSMGSNTIGCGAVTSTGTGTFQGTGNSSFAGPVGIGTTSPDSKLNIGYGSGVTNIKMVYDGSNNYWRINPQVSGANFSIQQNTTTYFQVLSGGNVIVNSGNVGINTVTPRKLADFLSTTRAQLRLSYTDNAVYNDFTTGSGGVLTIVSSAGGTITFPSATTGTVALTSQLGAMHTQNTDTKIDSGGVNEITAANIKIAYDRSTKLVADSTGWNTALTNSHVQNTDISTTSSSFIINSASSQGKIRLNMNQTVSGNYILDLQNDVLTNNRTTTFPDASGTVAFGTGTASQIAYWSDANTLGALPTATYPTPTELSYVKGVTSAIQTQLNAKVATTAMPVFTYDDADSPPATAKDGDVYKSIGRVYLYAGGWEQIK